MLRLIIINIYINWYWKITIFVIYRYLIQVYTRAARMFTKNLFITIRNYTINFHLIFFCLPIREDHYRKYQSAMKVLWSILVTKYYYEYFEQTCLRFIPIKDIDVCFDYSAHNSWSSIHFSLSFRWVQAVITLKWKQLN